MDGRDTYYRDKNESRDPHFGYGYPRDNIGYMGEGPALRYNGDYTMHHNATFAYKGYRSKFNGSDGSSDSDVSVKSRKRKYILIGILVAVVIVIIGIVGAVVAAVISSDQPATNTRMVEKKYEKEYHGEVKFVDKDWVDELADKDSTEYQNVKNEFIDLMDKKFTKSVINEYNHTEVDNIRQGSVYVEFRIIFVEIVNIVVNENDGTTAATTDDLPASVDINIDINDIVNIMNEIPEIEFPVVSDVNECQSNPCGQHGNCTDKVNDFECQCAAGYTGKTCDENIDECSSQPCQNDGVCQDLVNGYTCSCVDGTTGDNCELNIDECASQPCQNDAECLDFINGFICFCVDGYTGTLCANEINECDSNPCQNDGSCTDEVNGFSCECAAGFRGVECEIEKDECSTNPCENSGTCVDEVNGYKCICKPGYEGVNCETDINECDPDPCQNDGTCSDKVNGFTCQCVPGFTGNVCDTEIQECESNPCQNGGTCLEEVNGYKCACVAGFTGDLCDAEINECDSNPCLNDGLCVDNVNGFTCQCVAGYTGDICDGDIDDCSPNPCFNDGSCVDEVDDFLCNCVPGYEGKTCQIDIDDCSPNPCSNGGSCTDKVDDFLCDCAPGYDGQTCQIDIDDCLPNPCDNDGFCVDKGDDYECNCAPGYEGKSCETDVNDCDPNPCLNDGICIDEVNGFNCQCADGFVGDVCLTEINECEPNPCENGGQCTDQVNGFTCQCAAGFTGETCNVNIDDCSTNPCANGGTCVDKVNDYQCNCVFGFEGGNCETEITTTMSTSTTTSSPSTATTTSSPSTATTTSSPSTTTTTSSPSTATTTSSPTTATTTSSPSTATTTSSPSTATTTSSPSTATTTSSPSTTTTTSSPSTATTTSSPSTATTTSSPSTTTTTPTTTETEKSSTSTPTSTFSPTNTSTTSRTTMMPLNEACYTENMALYAVKAVLLEVPYYDGLCNSSTDEFHSLNQSTYEMMRIHLGQRGYSKAFCYTSLTECEQDENNTMAILEVGIVHEIMNNVELLLVFTDQNDAGLFVLNTITAVYIPGTSTSTSNPTTPRTTAVNYCNDDEYLCPGTSQCIPARWICDDFIDCPNGQDESGCDCPDLKCNNGDCYHSNATCDGLWDCIDGTDERDCPNECGGMMFECINIQQCVPLTSLCDGVRDCVDNSDEWSGCPEKTNPPPRSFEYEIRLMVGDRDTTSAGYGRVEVMVTIDNVSDTRTSTICSDGFDDREARVICRQIGARNVAESYANGNAYYGEGEGPVKLGNFRCTGDEDKLDECEHSGWQSVHCSHQQDASVSCGEDRFTTQTPPSTTSRTTMAPDFGIELVNGMHCLEGVIQVYHYHSWGTVCSDGFDDRDALVVCRSLGFSDFESYSESFGEGNGYILMDDLDCSGSESSLYQCGQNGWGIHNCSSSQAQSIRCAGNPITECEIRSEYSVNCSFEFNTCEYQHTILQGTTPWDTMPAQFLGIVDNEGTSFGYVAAFWNRDGSETDTARITTPVFNVTDSQNKRLEFYYQLHDSKFKDLIVYLKEVDLIRRLEVESELWSSIYLTRDKEYKWLYKCINLPLEQNNYYSLVFEANCGPKCSVAIDEITIAAGNCPESILDGPCDFERESTCGVHVTRDTNDRESIGYTWMRQITEKSKAEGVGHYMTVNSVFGEVGDEAIMTFETPSLGDYTFFRFNFHMNGDDDVLQVSVSQGDEEHIITTKQGNHGNVWEAQCNDLPEELDPEAATTFMFKAIRGSSTLTSISIDDVQFDTECAHPATCDTSAINCGWKMTSSDETLAWTFLLKSDGEGRGRNDIRLVNGESSNTGFLEVYHEGVWGRVCDDSFDNRDAQVGCRMLGYQSEGATYTCCNYGSYDDQIWLDELSCDGDENHFDECYHYGWGSHDCGATEHVVITCLGPSVGSIGSMLESDFFVLHDAYYEIGGWASLYSKSFEFTGGKQKFMFDYIKWTDEEILQVWAKEISSGSTEVLNKIKDRTMSLETMCINIPLDLVGSEIILGLTAIKSPNTSVETVVSNFRYEPGSCKENLRLQSCDFEKEHRLCGYGSSTEATRCPKTPAWSRESMIMIQRSRVMYDHTFSNQTGHFLYTASSESSEIKFLTIPASDSTSVCSLSFYYFYAGDGLSVKVNDEVTHLEHLPYLNVWMKACINITDTCTHDSSVDLDISFHATNSEAGLDDITLSTSLCINDDVESVTCNFTNGENCGYYTEGWSRSSDGELQTKDTSLRHYLLSPEFVPETEVVCVSLYISGNTRVSLSASLFYEMEKVSTSEEYFGSITDRHRVSTEFQVTADTTYRVLFNISLQYLPGITLHNITLESGTCGFIGFACTPYQRECDRHKCIDEYQICDGFSQCDDGSDETECNCGMQDVFRCTSGECIHIYNTCDGTLDCTDGSDEVCEPSINCTFGAPTINDCGYTLNHARVDINRLYMVWPFSYIASPPVTVESRSCLSVDFQAGSDVVFRFAHEKDDAFNPLAYSIYTSWNRSTVFLVDLFPGLYDSISLEAFSGHMSDEYRFISATITSIMLFSENCYDIAVMFDLSIATLSTLAPSVSTGFRIVEQTTISSFTRSESGSVPENFPRVEMFTPSYHVTSGDTVTLKCSAVYDNNMYQVIPTWYRNEIQIARLDDIMVNNDDNKYTISMMESTEGEFYNLDIFNITIDDMGYYVCVAQVLGYSSSTWPTSTTNLIVSDIYDDSCESLSTTENHFCYDFGYDRIKAPSDSGLQNIHQIRNHLKGVERYFSYVPQSHACYKPMLELACGLHASECELGMKVHPICREHCEEIADVCIDFGTIVLDVNSQLRRFCKYLPYSEEDSSCRKIWFGCGSEITLNELITTNLRSEGYPITAPSTSSCNYTIMVSQYYNTRVNISDLELKTQNCDTDALLVDGNRFCDGDDYSEDILIESTSFDISLSTSTESVSGFVIAFAPELKETICEILDALSHDTKSLTAVPTNGCTQWIFYLEDPPSSSRYIFSFVFNVSELTGCINFKDGDSELVESVCDGATDVIIESRTVIVELDTAVTFTMNYTLFWTYEGAPYNYTVADLKLVDGEADHTGHVYIVRSDGEQGYLCTRLDQQSANVICRHAGFASAIRFNDAFPANYSSQYKFIADSLRCTGKEERIDQCDILGWIPKDCDYCYCNDYLLGSVTCDVKSVTCDMKSKACGYTYDEYFMYSNYEGLYTNSWVPLGTSITILSPEFQYRERSKLNFMYRLTGSNTESMDLFIQTSDGTLQSIWNTLSDQIYLNGTFKATVLLPDNLTDTKLNLMFELTAGERSGLGLSDIVLDEDDDEMPAVFPDELCLFDDLDLCSPILDGVPCEVSMGHIWKIENNLLVGDSLYVSENGSFIDVPMSGVGGLYLHFKYSQTGISMSENDLTFKVQVGTDNTGYVDIFTGGEYINTMLDKQCVQIPEQSTDDFTLRFGFTTTTSDGNIYLDNIGINNQKCPHPASCDFETFHRCKYTLTSSNPECSWMVYSSSTLHYENGYEENGQQHVASVWCNYLTSSFTATMSTPLFDTQILDETYKCLSFQYLYELRYDDTPPFISLTVDTMYEGSENISTVIPLYHFGWKYASVPIHSELSSKAKVTITVNYLNHDSRNIGSQYMVPIKIDNVFLLTTNCNDGLEDIKRCDMENPAQCNMDTNSTVDSGYHWIRHTGTTPTENTGPSFDADGKYGGYYMYVDSSHGGVSEEANLWFYVDLSESSTGQHYSFSYHMFGSGVGTLKTKIVNQASNLTYDWDTVPRPDYYNMWHLSPCYSLPDNFVGDIYFQATRGSSIEGDIAIDNLVLQSGSCQEASVICSFDGDACGYIGEGDWTMKDGSMFTREAGSLHVPVYSLSTNSCISIQFTGEDEDFLVLQSKLDDGSYESHKFVVGPTGYKYGQINYPTNNQGLSIVIHARNDIKIMSVNAVEGECGPIDEDTHCTDDDHICREQCIPLDKRCDRHKDCSDGSDEEDCGRQIACNFDGDDCGFITLPNSYTQWEFLDSFIITQKLSKKSFSNDDEWENITLTGGLMINQGFLDLYLRNSLVQSVWTDIPETSCIQFMYIGNISALEFMIENEHTEERILWNDTHVSNVLYNGEWRQSQTTVGPGSWRVTLKAAFFPTVNLPNKLFVAVDSISVIPGECGTLECPDETPLQCADSSLCYSRNMNCDREFFCRDYSDENNCESEFKIPCDFESKTMCGYTSEADPYGTQWVRTPGYQFHIPAYDHTTGNTSGHYMWHKSKFGILSGRPVQRSTISSPVQRFDEDGCITFWYFLNSTAVQPSALSSQILVSVVYPDLGTTEFLWYDYVNRHIQRWLQGGVSVKGGQRLYVNFTGVSFETMRAHPGVQALDDVDFVSGDCPVSQICNEGSFQCRDTDVCIPISFVCDGGKDCTDGSDENNCDSRPDGEIQIAGGDGSYGELRYYQYGAWRHVCYNNNNGLQTYTVQFVCETLGFHGNFEAFNYTLPQINFPAINLDCMYGECSVSECDNNVYIGVRCSHSACFTGERLCPGTKNVCKPWYDFCDGFPDCPNNEDEKSCYCDSEDTVCKKTSDQCSDCETCESRGQLECANHQCFNRSARCDGVKDCDDGTDEYNCVEITDSHVKVYYDNEMIPVCIDTVMGRLEAELLCTQSGQGLLGGDIEFGHSTVDKGVFVRLASGTETKLVFEHKRNCYPLILNCELPACGSTMYMDELVSSYIIPTKQVELGEWPWQVLLHGEYVGGFCGGSIINERWILTAAHCVEDYNYGVFTIKAGIIHEDVLGEHGQEVYVATVYSHPNYTSDVVQGNDLALLELAYPLRFDNYTRQVCLGTERSLNDIIAMGNMAECFITGFGYTDQFIVQGMNYPSPLSEARISFVPRAKCEELFEAEFSGLSHDGLCVENELLYQTACYGDSGGPLVCKSPEGHWEQFGVTSYGSPYCTGDTPTVYCNIIDHKDWIESVSGLKLYDD